VRRTVRALEVAAITGEPFSSFARAWTTYPAEGMRAAGIEVPRDVLAERISRRVQAMLDAGWLEEVRELCGRGFGGWLTSAQAIGYAELARHVQGDMTLEDAVEHTVKRTRNLARRQFAWLRRDPRIRWFPVGPGGASEALDQIGAYMEAG
jgi:tRNA dimethylallyltransferase